VILSLKLPDQISMAKINSVRFFLKISIILFPLALLTHSCRIKDNSVNPADYELHISISSDKYASVSPDGALVAYYHQCLEYPEPEAYPTGLYVANIDGTNRKLLLKGDHYSPSWSPDGHWLVFSSDGTLEITNLIGDSIRTFQGIQDLPLYSPDWSADGKEILFSAPLTINGGVFKMSPDFHTIKRILDPQRNNGMYASWSPDRSKIVYQKGNQSWNSVELFIIDTALISEIRLTNDAKDDRDAVWSPSGDLIAWSRNVRVMIMSIDGTNQKTLDYGQDPSWSSKSDYIIYSNANAEMTKEVLWRINLDGSNKTQITF
jgi:Tol biopolymer transport system component